MKKIYILDGSGFLFRAYHAFPYMTDSDGFNVNVVYGFIRMMMKLLADKPDYFVIAWDAPTKTIRHEKFEAYKANRPEADPDLKRQIPYTQEVVAQLHLHSLQIPGFEADDIIASLARKYSSDKNIQVVVVSSDKDLKQLISDNVICKDAMKWVDTTRESFVREYGFEPENMLDYLALIWDSSDNIPWVSGIWPKKATKLIVEYKTVENIYEHLIDLPEDIRLKLEWAKDVAMQSKDLVSLYDIDALSDLKLEEFGLNMDWNLWDQVLVQNHKFDSMIKWLKELKNTWIMPEQSSLF